MQFVEASEVNKGLEALKLKLSERTIHTWE
jgi:hypothetical protein